MNSLSEGDFNRLEEWEFQARQRHHCSVREGVQEWASEIMVANVAQNASYWGQLATTFFPSVMPRALYWEMIRRRVVCALELWLINGWPHPDVEEAADLFEFLPFPQLVSRTSASSERLNVNEQKQLLGKGTACTWQPLAAGIYTSRRPFASCGADSVRFQLTHFFYVGEDWKLTS